MDNLFCINSRLYKKAQGFMDNLFCVNSRSYKEAQECVYEKTEYCGKELRGKVMKRLDKIKMEAEEYCLEQMSMCIDTFEEIGNTLDNFRDFLFAYLEDRVSS